MLIAHTAFHLLPPRLTDEQLGDSLEILHHCAEQGAPAWKLYRIAIGAVLWAIVHTVLGYRTLRRLEEQEKRRGAGD